MKLILLEAEMRIIANWNDTYSMIISASMGEIRFDEIKAWLEINAVSKS
jgi:hypothetical protein